jgi:hypothetical protein
MIGRIVSYAWASPNTLLGMIAGAAMLGLGARVRRVQGCVEFSGGFVGSFIASPATACPYRAMTLGHVILGTDANSLDCAREHEQIHVRQYERWGPFFLPAYLASSVWQLLRGRRCYRDNYFEREAFSASSAAARR